MKFTCFQNAISEIPSPVRLGTVTEAVGMIIEAKCPGAFVGELCELEIPGKSDETIQAQVVGFRRDSVLLMPFQAISGISFGTQVRATGSKANVKVGNSLLGRVIDALGRPLDGGQTPADLRDAGRYESIAKTNNLNPMLRQPITQVMATGIRTIDGFLTLGEGQRIGLMAGSGVGKSTLMSSICQYSDAEVNVIALIGERGREVEEFVNRTLGAEGLKKSVVIAATAQESPLMRAHAARSAMAIAEYFAKEGKAVCFMMDSITRFANALREIGLAAGEPPTVKGYTPSVFNELPHFIERCGNFRDSGSITGLFSVLVESDDFNDPVVDSVRAILDGHIVLSRKLAERNQYPAIDVLKSISRIYGPLNPDEVVNASRQLREWLADYEENRDILELGLFESAEDEKRDSILTNWQKLKPFLVQENDAPSSLSNTRTQFLELLTQ